MTTPRRVLYVNHEVECGGAEHSLLELLQGLDRERFLPHLACSMEGPLTDAARALGAEIHLVPMLFRGGLPKLWGLFRAAARLRTLVRRAGIQLVHTNSLIAGYCGVVAARMCKVPAVWHVRDIGYPEAARRLCTRAQRVIANSHATAASLAFPQHLTDRIEVVYNGVAPRFFEPADTRREVRDELRLAADERIVGAFGRLDPWKGHDDLIDAARHVLRHHPSTTFVIVGKTLFQGSRRRHGDHRKTLEQLARDRGIWGKVQFLGHREDVPRLMAAMDIVVQPSSRPEPFGRTLAEAQARGIPVIGTDLGGIPEVIDDGRNGLISPAGDPAALAERITSVLGDADLARRLGAAGRENARTRFTQARYVAGVEAVYDDI